MQHLHCLLMIYKMVTTKYKPSNMKAWHCRCKETCIRLSYITHLKTCYVLYARNPGEDNIIIIVKKHTTSVNDKYHDLPYYVGSIQRRKRYVKLRWFDRDFPDHEVIVETIQIVSMRLIDLKRKGMQSENTTTLG